MRNGFLAASLVTLALGGAARAQVGYATPPADPHQAVFSGWSGGAPVPGGAPPGANPEGSAVPGPGYPDRYGPCPYPPQGGCADEGPCFKPHVPNSTFVSAEYLLYFLKSGPSTFPLVTTSPAASLGQLGSNNTTVLFGQDNFHFNPASGLRVTAGHYFGDDQRWGFNVDGFVLEKRFDRFFVASDNGGTPLLARPFFNSENGLSTSLLVAAPGFVKGAIAVDAQSQLWGADLNLLFNAICPTGEHGLALQLLFGGKYLNLEEGLNVSQLTQLLPGQRAPFGGLTVTNPTQISVVDHIFTKNIFSGANFGLQTTYCLGDKWFVQAGGSSAYGVVHQIIDISGTSTALIPPGGQILANGAAGGGGFGLSLPGGLFGTSTNIGHFHKDDFAWEGEANVRLGYHLTPHISTFVGYDFLYLSNVVRPGDQIDPNINPGNLPTSVQFGRPGSTFNPRVVFKQTDFFVNGFTAGLTFVY
jgi:hypothetical protein